MSGQDQAGEQPSRPGAPPLPPRPPARRSLWRRALLILIPLAIVAAVAWRIIERPPTQQVRGFRSSGALPVGVAAVTQGNIKITINALGTVTPLDTVTVLSQVSGPLIEVGFREGQEVKQGDLLAEIDPRPFQAALDQAQGQLVKDQAALKEAQVDLVRYNTLAAQNSIARQQAEDQQYVVQQDEGQVKLDQAMVDTAKLNLSYCRIVSPINGRIGLRLVDPGNYVQTGTMQAGTSSAGIAVITQMQPITVVFALPEDSLGAILKRMRAGAQLQAIAYDRSGATELGDGVLSAIDSQINTSTGTINLKAQFDNGDEALFPNQFVNVALTVDELHDAMVIPTAAIQRGEPGTFVYLVKPDNTVTVRPVKLGPSEDEQVTVRSGLRIGDKVVVDGADKLRDGATVRISAGTALSGSAPLSDSEPLSGATNGQQHHHRQKPDGAPGGSNNGQ